jgi:hypothetical protein
LRLRAFGGRTQLCEIGFESVGSQSLTAAPAPRVGDDFVDAVVDGDRTGIGFEREAAAHKTRGHTVAVPIEVQTDVFVGERLHFVAIVIGNDRQGAQSTGLESIDGSLARLAVLSLVSDFRQPLTRLAVHVMQVSEVSQRPETLARIADGALHFSFLPTCRHVASFRIETVFAGKGEKPWKETDQPAIVLGDSGREIVIGNLACHTTERGKRMHMAADEGLESLTVGELQVEHAAVRFDQGECIKLALVAGIIEHAEVSPINLEALAWRWLHAQKGSVGFQLRAGGMHIIAQDSVSAAIAEWPQFLFDDSCRHAGVLFQPFGDSGFEGIEFTFALSLGGLLGRRIEVLLDGPPTHAQVALDLADRPVLGPVQAMQVVDLIGGEHGAISVIRQKPPVYQDVVVCKIPTAGVCGAEVLPKSRLAPELSCCLQAPGVRRPTARPLRRNALGRKLSCCLQDRSVAVSGPERAAAGDSARRRPGAVRDTAANSLDSGIAISADYPGIPGGIPGPPRPSGDDIQRAGGAGNRDRCTPTAPADISMA